MFGNINILFYSNYSEACKKFFSHLESSEVNFTQLMYIKFVNIDTEYIRNKLLTDTNVRVEKVPCIVEIRNDGSVNKYEDMNIYNWSNKIIDIERRKEKDREEKAKALEELSTNLESCGEQSKELYENMKEYEEYIERLKEEINYANIALEKKEEECKLLEKEKEMEINFNKMRHNEIVEDNESVISDINGKPEVHIRTDQSNFSNLKFDQPPMEENRDMSHKLNKSENLMASAEAMQKERDTHEEKTIRKPPNF